MPPVVWSRIPGCDGPAIPSDVGAQSLALLYQFQQSERLPSEALEAAQFFQLQQLFADAMASMPFWKERLETAGYRAGMPVDAAGLDSFRSSPGQPCSSSGRYCSIRGLATATVAFIRARHQAQPVCR